jgi:hypothetical protein
MPLLERWEALEPGKQFVVSYPVMVVFLSIVHWTILSQPAYRGAIYGLFWALPAAILIVVGSQNERRKRAARRSGDGSSDDG